MDESHVMHLKHDDWFTILTTATCHKTIADELLNVLYFALSSVFCHHRLELQNKQCMNNSPRKYYYITI